MKKWLVCAALAGVSGPAIAGDKPLYQPVPAWVTPAPAIDPAKLGDDAPLYLTLDTQDRLADGTVWSYHDVATRMASPEVVAQAGTISIEWSPSKGDLIVHKVEIIRGGQHIDALAGGRAFTVIRREQQLEKLAIDGQLTATLAVEGLQVGDVLHTVVTLSRKEDALGGGVQDVVQIPAHPVRVGFARTRLLWPAALRIRWKVAAEGADLRLTTLGAERELSITGVLPKAAELPADTPLRFRKLPIVEASSFADWGAVSKVMAPYYAVDGAIKPGGALAGEVAAIAKAQTDLLRRADAALELVQSKVRYLFNGLDKGNYVPQPAEQTWALRYGDCKAKTVLLLAILRALDVPAEPVLASADLGDAVPQRLPSAAAFNHVLVHATVAGKDYWLDGTGAGTRFADIGDVPPFRWVLPLRTAGADLLAVPMRAPARPQAEIAVDLDQRAGVQLPAVARVKLTVRGASAAMLGIAKTQGSKEQKDEAVQRMVTEIVGGDAVITGYTLGYDPVEAVATIDATSTVTTLWDRADDRYRLTLDKAVSKLGFDPDRSRPAWATLPVGTGAPATVVTALRVQLPGGGKGFTLDGDTDVPAPLAATTIRRTVTQADGVVGVSDLVTASGADVAPGDVTAMRAKVALAKSRVLTLVAPADLPPRWQVVRDARAAGTLKPVLAAYTAAIAVQPDEANSYENRASFLRGVYDWKAALPDLDKAIALEPTVDRYLSRADAELVVGADARALADLQAAQKLAPGSAGVVNELGTYLVDHGQKEAALAMVQEQIDAGGKGKAGMLSQKATFLSRAGDRDQAISVIDQAVAAKPGDPDLLNARCWLKAQLNVQLDTALKDCTRSIELSDSTAAALDSRALVYFRLGRPDDALADLTAALDQNSSMAGSLYLRGIVKTRQGKASEGKRDIDAATFIAPRIATNYTPFGIVP